MRRTSVAAAWVLLAASFAVLVAALGTGQPSPDVLFQSDALYMPALYRDIVQHGGRWIDWRLPPAPYFFPDLALYFGWNAVLGDFRLAIIALAGTQVALFALGGQLLMRAIDREALLPQIAAVLLPAGLMLACPEPALWMLLSAHHFGGVLVGLFALASAIVFAREGQRWLGVALAVLCGLAGASDALFLVSFAAPAGLALWRARARRATLVVALSSLIGWGLPPALYLRYRVHGVPWKLQPGTSVETLEEMVRRASESPLLLVVGWCLAVAVVAVRWRQNVVLAATALGSVLAVTGAMALTGMNDPRYLVAPLFVPLVAACAALRKVPRGEVVALTLVAVGLVATGCPGPQPNPLHRYTTPLVTCLDGLGARRGISDYWRAKQVSMLSATGLELHQVMPSGEPYHWINNKTWYVPGPAYELAVTTELDRAAVLARFGDPSRTVTCAGEEVLLYDEPTVLLR